MIENYLRELRSLAGLTQVEVAYLSKVSLGTLSRVESGKTKYSFAPEFLFDFYGRYFRAMPEDDRKTQKALKILDKLEKLLYTN